MEKEESEKKVQLLAHMWIVLGSSRLGEKEYDELHDFSIYAEEREFIYVCYYVQ